MHRIINGKFDELKDDFANCGIDLLFPNKKLELEECAETLLDNARMKALAALEQQKDMADYYMGDDSGLFITALDYFPGVHSRRWYGEETDDKGRCLKILEMMKGEKNRTAHLISRFSIIDDKGKEVFNTKIDNTFDISKEYKGDNGFGYDCILIPSYTMIEDSWHRLSWDDDDKYDLATEGCLTIAEFTQKEKNAINNRGAIARQIKNALFDGGIE